MSNAVVKEYIAMAERGTSRTLSGHRKKVHTVAWNRSGKRLATGSVDATARVWQVDHRHGKDSELKGHQGSVDQLCWSPLHDDLLATASSDKSVIAWDTRAAKVQHTVNTNGENINIGWSPDGKYVMVGDKNDELSVIDTCSWTVVHKRTFDTEVNEFAWDKDGNVVFLMLGNGHIDVVKFPELESLFSVPAHPANIYCADRSPEGTYLAVGGADAHVSLWDYSEMICVRTFGRMEWPVRTVSFSHDGDLLALASEDLEIEIAHTGTGHMVHRIACNAPTNSVAWNPRKPVLAYAGDDKDDKGHYGLVHIFSMANKA